MKIKKYNKLGCPQWNWMKFSGNTYFDAVAAMTLPTKLGNFWGQDLVT